MKKIFLLLTIVLFAFSINAQPPEGPVNTGMAFGVSTTAADAINVNDLPSLLDPKTPKEIKVKGKVIEVCQAEGCWLRMQTTDGTIMVRMKNHSFFVPVSLNGKTIIADGTAAIKQTSVEMLRHYAEDAGKSKEEIAAIKELKKEIVLQAKGILVL